MFVENSLHPDVLRYPHPILKASKLRKSTVHEFTILGKKLRALPRRHGQSGRHTDQLPAPRCAALQGQRECRGRACVRLPRLAHPFQWDRRQPVRPGKICSVPMLKTWERYSFIWVALSAIRN